LPPFGCPNCRRLIHFEARVCPACHFTLGYDPVSDAFLFLGDNLTTWRDVDGEAHAVVVCANNGPIEICNWLVTVGNVSNLCRACRHNRMIPDLSVADVPERWARIEAAKRRMMHTLLRLGLPLDTRAERPDGLAFDFLYDASAEASGQPLVLTGHNGGLITLNVIEADDVQRERIRREMGEPYRTLLGHFRHEVGHHFWERLIRNTPEQAGFRLMFGDESLDYQAALQQHYQSIGCQSDWSDDYVSGYACSHPWEDFAETWAHYLHIVDTLEMARAFGVGIAPRADDAGELAAEVDFNPYRSTDIQAVMDAWVPLTVTLNSLNRCMGEGDLYPFVLSPDVVAKLAFIQSLVHGQVPADENSL